MKRLLITVAAASLGLALPAHAEGQWAHLRVVERAGSGARIEMNLPVPALRAAARLLRTDREARIEISGVRLRLHEITGYWSALRAQPPGAKINRDVDDRTVTVTREADGMSIRTEERWSTMDATLSIRDTLADALLRGNGSVDFDAVAAALATTNGAPLKVRSSDATTMDIWVDEHPSGVSP